MKRKAVQFVTQVVIDRSHELLCKLFVFTAHVHNGKNKSLIPPLTLFPLLFVH